MSVTIGDIRDLFMDALIMPFTLPITRNLHNLITCAAAFESGLDVLADALRTKQVCGYDHIFNLGDFHIDERPFVYPCTAVPLLIDDLDVASLEPTVHVLDTIVNMFTSSLDINISVSILATTVLQSWILGHRIKISDFAHASFILIPAQVDGNHWILLYADKPSNIIHAMDSNATTPSTGIVKLAVHASRFLNMKNPRLEFVRTPQQITGSNDCAMFVCQNIINVLFNEPHCIITRDDLRRQAIKKRGR